MNLFALDAARRLCPAHSAKRSFDYTCQDCGGPVRLRGGTRRRAHFFHLQGVTACRSSQKSLEHLQVQHYLQRLLSCSLERRFPDIGRVADAVWEEHKLVIEVQCSPISTEELQARNRDYGSLGYEVLWILHQKNFNKYKLSAAELALRQSPHYFTDITPTGHGKIYDQVAWGPAGLRQERSQHYPVSIQKMRKLPRPSWRGWNVCFEGDAVSCGIDGPKALAPPSWQQRLWVEGKRIYVGVLQLLLERVCR